MVAPGTGVGYPRDQKPGLGAGRPDFRAPLN